MYRALTGSSRTQPIELLISRVCEEFKCLPTRAMWELENDPDQVVLRVLLVRDFMRVREAWEAHTKDEKHPKPEGALADLFIEIEAEVTREDAERAMAEAAQAAIGGDGGE